MRPIKTEYSNLIYRGDGNLVMDLHCERGESEVAQTAIFAVWEPSDEEREMIAAGANLRLGIHGMEPIPPTSLEITTDKEVSGA